MHVVKAKVDVMADGHIVLGVQAREKTNAVSTRKIH